MDMHRTIASGHAEDGAAGINIAAAGIRFAKAKLVPPDSSGYIHIAAEIDSIWPFGLRLQSRDKREAIARSKSLAARLEKLDSVIRATVFVARLIPPAVGDRMETREKVHVARFDLVVLIETRDPQAAAALQDQPLYKELVSMLREKSRFLHVVRARNERKMGEVDSTRDGVFLFNYFHGDDPSKLIPVWYYTAGWFQTNTNLDNSLLMQPEPGQESEYGIINHCRWDRWRDVLPHLAFRPTFRSYVMGNFDANGIVPMPILYRLA